MPMYETLSSPLATLQGVTMKFAHHSIVASRTPETQMPQTKTPQIESPRGMR
jgi:hypothetical protein